MPLSICYVQRRTVAYKGHVIIFFIFCTLCRIRMRRNFNCTYINFLIFSVQTASLFPSAFWIMEICSAECVPVKQVSITVSLSTGCQYSTKTRTKPQHTDLTSVPSRAANKRAPWFNKPLTFSEQRIVEQTRTRSECVSGCLYLWAAAGTEGSSALVSAGSVSEPDWHTLDSSETKQAQTLKLPINCFRYECFDGC